MHTPVRQGGERPCRSRATCPGSSAATCAASGTRVDVVGMTTIVVAKAPQGGVVRASSRNS